MRSKKELLLEIINDINKRLLANEISTVFIKRVQTKYPERSELAAQEINFMREKEDLIDQLEIALEILDDKKVEKNKRNNRTND